MPDADAGERDSLPLTGERTVPDVNHENYWFRRHEAAYLALRPQCHGALVLEAGCGEGYGAARLAEVASRVIALDYDGPVTAHVRHRYPHLDVVRGNLAGLPIRSCAVDVVATLQVIEHLWDQRGFLDECFRVLRPGGTVLLTTPNRITFSPAGSRLNPFHTREFAADELIDIVIDSGFRVESLHGLRHGPRLQALDAAHGGSLIEAQLRVVMGYPPGAAPWPSDLLTDIESVRADDFDIGPDDIDHCLDLVVRARRPA